MTSARAALRVATWNIRAAIGPEKPFPDRWWRLIDARRLRAIGAFLAGIGADLVALQEVALVSRDGELLDNAGDLARQLGMEVRYGATRTFPVAAADGLVTGSGCFGNAILSRLPISSWRAALLPAAPVDALIEPADSTAEGAGVRYRDAPEWFREPRTLLVTEVAGIAFVSTHLSHRGSRERALQAAATAEAVAGVPGAVVLADLNAPIEAPELVAFAGWTDGFAIAGVPPGDDRRVSTDDGYRFDHVLGRGVQVSGCRVVRESGDLSDHYPVVAEILADARAASPTGNR
ncbi:MAG: endonuclease/exonuclease/phosphatase family protein [Chloroflexi bacterium]|nr:endonuclease/exonuclease/phosphatase family protein [Chloroflexota bacterium]